MSSTSRSKVTKLSVAKPLPPPHSSEIKRLNRIIGQLEGVKRMIEDRRYCPDILVQTRAATSAIAALEGAILSTHLKHCVHHAMNSKDSHDAALKIQELVELFAKHR